MNNNALPIVVLVGVLTMTGCGKSQNGTNEVSIDTPEGTVTADTRQVDEFPQKITLVSPDELKQFEAWASETPTFVATYHSEIAEPSLKDCDQAFRAWLNAAKRSHTDQEVIQILGSYLGQRCVRDLSMEWVKVSDQYGEDYAVRHAKYETMAFPFSSVMKRIEDRQYDFMHGVFHAIKYTVESGDLMERDSQANQ